MSASPVIAPAASTMRKPSSTAVASGTFEIGTRILARSRSLKSSSKNAHAKRLVSPPPTKRATQRKGLATTNDVRRASAATPKISRSCSSWTRSDIVTWRVRRGGTI